MSFSVIFLILSAGLLGSGQPGAFERCLGNSDGLLIASARGEGRPCGFEGRPEVLGVRVLDVIFGPFSEGEIEVLIVADDLEPQEDGTKALWVLGRSTIEDGAGCPVAPSHAVKRIVPCAENCERNREIWRQYANAVRSLPPKGTARERALIGLWVDTVIDGRDELRAHAVLSLEETARSRTFSREVFGRLTSLLVDCEPDPISCVMALRVLSRIVAPEHVGRHVFDGGSEQAERARDALLGALFDPHSEVRAMAIRGLAPLSIAGDRLVYRHLQEVSRTEECPLVIEVLRAVRSSSQASPSSGRRSEGGEDRIGLRMLLVLVGLAALVGMTLLPVVLGRVR